MSHLLVVDDEKNIREGLKKALEPLGHTVEIAINGNEGFKIIQNQQIDLAIVDIKMPQISGLEMLEKLKEYQLNTIIIFITGHGTVETAVEAMQLGAYDFLTKPINLDKLEILIERALNLKQLSISHRALTVKVKEYEIEKHFLGRSNKIKHVIDVIKKVSPTNANIYIYGESGTGKEEVCNAIHNFSMADKPLIKVNCASLSSSLIESELFGHEKGAFTGADKLKIGRFEAANGGTLFLDEVSEIPLEVQVKLLRVLQEKKIERVGSHTSIPINCRIISASNCDLAVEIEKKKFREDLFYRLNVIDIVLPPLRERREDIDFLVHHFFEQAIKQYNCHNIEITQQVITSLHHYNWPGNIRELKNVIEKLVVMYANEKITTASLPDYIKKEHAKPNIITLDLGITLADAEKKIIFETIDYCDGNKSKTAKVLDIGRKTLHRKINEAVEKNPNHE